jgi:16S rRNA (uracil1498-N3)-methyltransferase
MNRFFLSPQNITAQAVTFPADIGHQIRRVLRLREDEKVLVLDNTGSAYEVSLLYSVDGEVHGEIQKRISLDAEPSIQLSLYIGLTQREKFEWILQKGTELGVSRFVPFTSERSLIQKYEIAEKKSQRWQKIIQEAAEQSHRGRIPVLASALSFPIAVKQALGEHQICIIPWEEEQAVSLRSSLTEASSAVRIAVMIGPEGGFSPVEVQSARECGMIAVTLGKRILRMETAALAAAAMVMYHLGQME